MSRIDSHISGVQFRLTLSILVEWLATAPFALATGTLTLIIIERMFQFGIPKIPFWVGLGLVAVIAIGLREVLWTYTDNWLVFLGALYVICVMCFPQGLTRLFVRAT